VRIPTARTWALLAAGVLVASSCASGPSEPPVAARDVTGITDPSIPPPRPESNTSTPSSAPVEPLEYTIEWTALSDRVDEGWLTVPLDYGDPRGDTIDLYVVRHRADPDRTVGPLLANRGGPGADGAVLALSARSFFDDAIVDNFDVIGWDPRGTGRSEGAVDCIDDAEYDRFYSEADITPDDAAERQAIVDLAEEFAASCIERVPTLQYVGTNSSARDMDAIRRALGAEQVSYFGFSYGSELGGVWATLFPTTVRAAVFDGAADPAARSLEVTLQQGAGFEAALDTFLERCAADSSCAFHNDGDPAGAFDRLMASLDESPIPSVAGRVPANRAVAVIAVAQAMYSDSYWPAFERALEDAAAGDGAGLLALHDLYYDRGEDGSYPNLIEAFQVINCADDPERLSVDEADDLVEQRLEVAPRVFPYTTGSYGCTFFPEALDPRIEITGAGAGPIVVVGTTGDPATPLGSSRAMADALEDGRLVVVEGDEHTGYRGSDCVQDIVHEYLLQLVAPADGTRCDS
jgi:pimeloyl-ACP methyl ester carboxylesterase